MLRQEPSSFRVIRAMGWASLYIVELQQGRTVSFRPRGNSMVGRIRSGQLCTIKPVADVTGLKVGDIVLCEVGRAQYLHIVKAIRVGGFLIGNNRGGLNGWTPGSKIYGQCVHVE